MIVANRQFNNAQAFKGDIIFSRKLYNALPLDQLKKEGKYIGNPWCIEDARMLDEGFSDDASVCTMGFLKLQGAQEGFMLHSRPFNNTFEKVEKIVVPVLEKFKNSGKVIEGLLYGANLGTKNSLEQAKNFMKLFDDFGVQYSAFLAQRAYENPISGRCFATPRVDMFVSAPKNQYILSAEKEPMFFKNPRFLKDRFVIVKKAPQDNIRFV